ncbi:MAG: hypothetical protein GY853_09420, partial [PVC group bacterium]|nr:hypothetical protein [PVC group bacterium]
EENGLIDISVNNLEIRGNKVFAGIRSNVLGMSKGSSINIQAGQMILTQGAQILNRTLGVGDSGTITISVDGAITIAGDNVDGTLSGIVGESGNEEIANLGNAADINIQAQQIMLANGGVISSEAYGFGNGGNIAIRLTDNS